MRVKLREPLESVGLHQGLGFMCLSRCILARAHVIESRQPAHICSILVHHGRSLLSKSLSACINSAHIARSESHVHESGIVG